MDRIWQWAWDRYGPRGIPGRSWVRFSCQSPSGCSGLCSIVAFKGSRSLPREAAAVAPGAAIVAGCPTSSRASAGIRLIEQWGRSNVDRATTGRHLSCSRQITIPQSLAGRHLPCRAGGRQWGRLPERAGGCCPICRHGAPGTGSNPVDVCTAFQKVPAASSALTVDTAMGDSLPARRRSRSPRSNNLRLRWRSPSAFWPVRCWHHRAGSMMPADVRCRSQAAATLRGCRSIGWTLLQLRYNRFAARPTMNSCRTTITRPSSRTTTCGALSASFNRMQAGWPSGDDSTPPSAPTSIRPWQRSFSSGRRCVHRRTPRSDSHVHRHPRLHPYAEAHTAEDTVARLNACSRSWCPPSSRPGARQQSSSATALWRSSGTQRPPDHADAAVKTAVVIDRLVPSDSVRSSNRHRHQHRGGDRRNHRRGRQTRVHPHRGHRQRGRPRRTAHQDHRGYHPCSPSSARRFCQPTTGTTTEERTR